EQREEKFNRLKFQIRDLIAPYIYGEGEETLEEIIGKLLLKNGGTLAVAESCTGGAVSRRITRVAGASAYFACGAVTYSNEAKVRFLGVRTTTLDKHGPVSEETVIEMAEGIKRQAGTTVGLGVTGIAGPTGGSAEIPVGTVWVGLARGGRGEARRFRFHGDRERVILGASQAALNCLRLALLVP
ncbi:MAG: CinA family protein, partial [Candidatus Binatia bacterium]